MNFRVKFWLPWIIAVFGIPGSVYYAIQLYGVIFTKDFDIKATGSHHEHYDPYPIVDFINNVLGREYSDSIDSVLRIEVDSCLSPQDHGNNISAFLRSRLPDYSDVIYDLRSYWTFRIQNDGSREVKGLVLQLPSSGYCFIEHIGKEDRNEKYDHRIDLGSLLPGEGIRVVCWADKLDSKFDEKDTRVSFSSGSVKIDYPTELHGFKAWVGNNSLAFIAFTLVILLLIPLSILIFQEEKSKTDNSALDESEPGE